MRRAHSKTAPGSARGSFELLRGLSCALLCGIGAACATTGGADPAVGPEGTSGNAALEAARQQSEGSMEDLALLLSSVGELQAVAGVVTESVGDPQLLPAGGGAELAAGGERQVREVAQGPLPSVAGSADAAESAGPKADGLIEAPGESEPAPTAAEDSAQDSIAPAAGVDDEPELNPYIEFGERILVHVDGRITKPYPVSPQKGAKLLQLMLLYADFPIQWGRVGADAKDPLDLAGLGLTGAGPDEVEIVLLEDWDLEFFEDLRQYPPAAAPVAAAVADWFMVTARPHLLREVEAFVDTFLTSVPQIEIEAKIIEIAETDTLDIGISGPDGVPIFQFPPGVFVQDFTYDLSNMTTGQEAVLNLGGIQDEVMFNMVIEAIATWENVTIMSQPKIVVREGTRADIVGTQELPYFDITGINPTGGFNAALKFKPVGVQLYVIPRVLGSNTVSLHIDVEASQPTGTSVTFTSGSGLNATSISNPVIANRSARTVVHLEPGQAVILGGLTSERTQEVVEKVPFLGDLPLLGIMFRNRQQKKERVHVLFFIRPRILQGIEFQHAGVYGEDW